MKVLFQLISGQVIPNITANDFIKPDKVYYFYTAQSKKELELIIKINTIPHIDIEISAYDYDDVYSRLKKVLNEIEGEVSDIYLNFTNGTKIMSIAAYNLFTEKQFDRIYINTEKNEVLIFENNLPVQSRNIESLIDIEDYFALHGHRIKSYSHPEEILINNNYVNLYNFLVTNFYTMSKKILKFASKYNNNKYANFETKGLSVTFTNKKVNIVLENDGNKLSINDESLEILKFMNGDWLEYYCYKELEKLQIFDKLYLNVKVAWKEKDLEKLEKNQIDVFGIKGTTPYVIECKSGAVKQEAIGQLAAIRTDYLDRYSKLILISYFPTQTTTIEKATGNNDILHILSKNIAKSKNEIVKAKPKLR